MRRHACPLALLGAIVTLLGAVGISALTSAASATGPPLFGAKSTAGSGLTAGQRRRADKLTSQFENSTSEIQYCYVEALDDGRGYTVGRAGFTSGTGDLLEVAERYTKIAGENALSPLLSRLRELAAADDGSIVGLEALPEAWNATCAHPRQRGVQDAVVDREYYLPARRHWRKLGLRRALSLAAIYDADIRPGPHAELPLQPTLRFLAALT